MEHLHPIPDRGQRDGARGMLVRIVQLLARQAAGEFVHGQCDTHIQPTTQRQPSPATKENKDA